MDDQQNGGGYTPPAGLTPAGAATPIASNQSTSGYTPPQGLKPVGAATPIDNPQPRKSDEIQVTHPWYTPSGIAERAGSALEGAGEGVFSTLAGASDIANKVVGDGKPGVVSQTLHHLAGDDNEKGSSNIYNKIGYGGETILEMFMGDEALKGLSTADKALAAGKALKTIEKSPKLAAALKEGAAALAKRSAQAAAVQGGQTYIRSGGNAKEAAVAGLEGGATAGVLEGALGAGKAAAGAVRNAVTSGSESAAKLAEAAENAPDKQSIVQNIQGQLQNAKTALHTNYEAGIQDIQNRLGNATVEAKGSPMSARAKELLANPDPEDHAWTAQAKKVAGDQLDKSTKELLQNIADGVKPLTEDDIAAAEAANKPSGLVDEKGNPLQQEKVEPQPKPVEALTVKDLIDQRQAIRKAADAYEPGDVNARALNNMLFSIDDTIGKIAEQSGDPQALADYRALRGDYKTKINSFNNPVIKNLMDGKLDDAAKAFIATKNASGLPSAGRTVLNARDMQNVLGEAGFDHFRTQVFDGLLKNATGEQGFNPAKFMDTWNKIADGTKSDLFAVDSAKPSAAYINQLASDAKTAANMQKLARYGVLSVAGAAGTATGHLLGPAAAAVGGVGTILGLLMGHAGESGSGIAKGREVIDYIANHPKMWAALRRVSQLSEGAAPAGKLEGAAVKTAKATSAVANAAPTVGRSAVALANDQPDNEYSAAQAGLSGR